MAPLRLYFLEVFKANCVKVVQLVPFGHWFDGVWNPSWFVVLMEEMLLRCVSAGEYHLLLCLSCTQASVVFLVSTQPFLRALTELKVVVPGQIAEFELKISHYARCRILKFVG